MALPFILFAAFGGMSTFSSPEILSSEKLTGTGVGYVVYSIPGRTRNIGLISAVHLLSAALNAGVTGLIIWKLLRSRKKVSNLLNVPDKTMYTGVIGLLIESALPFTIAAILAAVTNLPRLRKPISIYFNTLWVIAAVRHIISLSLPWCGADSHASSEVVLPTADYLPRGSWKIVHGCRRRGRSHPPREPQVSTDDQ